MPKYPEIHAYVMIQIQKEISYLRSANLRLWHSLAILSTIPPTALDLHHFLWVVDWCSFDCADTEHRIQIWWERLYCLWRANQLVEF